MTRPFSRMLLNRPLALHLDYAAALAAAWSEDPGTRDTDRGFGLINGVAVIPVRGMLLPGDFAWGDWATGYDHIRRGMAAAVAATDVRGIALDINSPGGTVSGLFDLADAIHAARGPKPIHAILGDSAYSAAYAIASAADKVTVPRTGGTGSIGVIWMHVDESQALEQGGWAVTILTHGAQKADGAPQKPLSDGARTRIQSDIDAMGELFVKTVARNRNLDAASVRAMEAGTFLGDRGVRAGLADAVRAPDEAFRDLTAASG